MEYKIIVDKYNTVITPFWQNLDSVKNEAELKAENILKHNYDYILKSFNIFHKRMRSFDSKLVENYIYDVKFCNLEQDLTKKVNPDFRIDRIAMLERLYLGTVMFMLSGNKQLKKHYFDNEEYYINI